MQRSRNLHRIVGLVLLAPLVGWALTGFLFFLKPGWDAAYSPLAVQTYPLTEASVVPPQSGWIELRRMRTVLGEHLIVRSNEGWSQIDPATLQPRGLPGNDELTRLVDDALASNRERYGRIESVVPDAAGRSASIRTATGAAIDLSWDRLQLSQSGRDTRRIDALYRIHYLQWTGWRALDQVLGVAGIVLILVLAALGVRIAVRTKA